MLKHFTGTHDHKLDGSGRVSLPTEFRRVLDAVGSSGGLYIVPQLGDPRVLVVFTIDAYSALLERHAASVYHSDREQERREAKLMGHAIQVQVDDAGRMVLAKPLREKIGLEKEVRFVGKASSFEIWRPDAREAYEADLALDDAEKPIRIDRRGLH